MSNRVVISIRKALSPDLAFRLAADRLFDYLEALDVKEITIDFTGIESISRSFAHQYTIRKENSSKIIEEMNVPSHIERMFQIVKHPKTATVFAGIEEVKPLVLA
jgi:hypothetical protein